MIRHVAAAVAALVLAASAQAMTFSDGNFANGNWSAEQMIVTGPQPSDPNAFFTAEQVPAGGVPGAYRQTTHTYGGPVLQIEVAHLRDGAIYDPSLGAIEKLIFGFDLAFFNYPGTQPGASYAVGYAPLLMQNGQYYIGPVVVTVSAAWESFTVEALAGDFHLLNDSALPDFSANGAPIQFGFATLNGTASEYTTSTISGIDNWQVEVIGSPAVPEPASWALMLVGFGAVGTAMRGRRKVALHLP